MPRDKILFLGKIKLRVLPGDLTLAEFMEWWPRLTEKERDRYTEYETRNLITTAGRSQVLTYIGAPNLSPVVSFSQYFSVGTGATLTVNPGDSHINTELTRLVPSTYTVSGNGVDISTFFGTSQGNGTWSNCARQRDLEQLRFIRKQRYCHTRDRDTTYSRSVFICKDQYSGGHM